ALRHRLHAVELERDAVLPRRQRREGIVAIRAGDRRARPLQRGRGQRDADTRQCRAVSRGRAAECTGRLRAAGKGEEKKNNERCLSHEHSLDRRRRGTPGGWLSDNTAATCGREDRSSLEETSSIVLKARRQPSLFCSEG